MPRPELIFQHSANGGGCNARELCKGQHLVESEHDARRDSALANPHQFRWLERSICNTFTLPMGWLKTCSAAVAKSSE